MSDAMMQRAHHTPTVRLRVPQTPVELFRLMAEHVAESRLGSGGRANRDRERKRRSAGRRPLE